MKKIRKNFLCIMLHLTIRIHPRKYIHRLAESQGGKTVERQNFTLFPPNAVRGPRFSSRLAPGVKITSTRVYLSGNGGAPGVVLARL